MTQVGFGIDIGGSGIKGARVDLETGEFIGDRIKILTPKPATPEAVAATVKEIVDQAKWEGPVGIAMPSVIQNQVAHSAANIDPSWIDVNVHDLYSNVLGHENITVLNDADAAGIAEVRYGDPQAREGAVILLTFGTGIGSAMLINGTLFPNTELGHILLGDKEAEHIASSAAKDRDELGYGKWSKRVAKVMREYERLLNPSLFIVGGGISRKAHKWVPLLDIKTPVVAAQLRNQAGIAGAALAVTEGIRP
ncbi:MAG: ROK family protein [Corynebacterium sp.]|nr:ROK family protein [Corynebacterium sp.]